MVVTHHRPKTSGVSNEELRQMIHDEVVTVIRAEIPDMFGSIKTTLIEMFDERYAAVTEVVAAAATTSNFDGEVVASASFAEAIWFYPSEAVAIKAALTYAGMFQTFAHNKFQPTEYISFSDNMVSPNFPPMRSNNISEAEKLISQGKVALVFVDPIYCNGEICNFKQEQLQSLRTACDKAGFESGLGVTGRLWAHEVLGVKPDLRMVKFGSLAIHGVLVNEKMKAHICKFEEDYIPDECSGVLECHVREIRASGPLAAVELDVEAQHVVDKCKENGVLIISAVGKENNIIQIKLSSGIVVHDMAIIVDILQECLKDLD
ncbi:acetylornithine aminotransferase, chloroplastic/mitochondrial [Lactuca sativa]|uniref:acetylornithine aminotransferase, chloroplastic/mitochondrial n=1 Tax=Lactuca sativa TaxID=4236 RepID=UPI000CD8EB87|nr:acetylornithine aminotransferase, chloroplastic/mitochondrial [Lactuca sativa]